MFFFLISLKKIISENRNCYYFISLKSMDKILKKKSDTNISTDQTVIFYKEIETKFIKF